MTQLIQRIRLFVYLSVALAPVSPLASAKAPAPPSAIGNRTRSDFDRRTIRERDAILYSSIFRLRNCIAGRVSDCVGGRNRTLRLTPASRSKMQRKQMIFHIFPGRPRPPPNRRRLSTSRNRVCDEFLIFHVTFLTAFECNCDVAVPTGSFSRTLLYNNEKIIANRFRPLQRSAREATLSMSARRRSQLKILISSGKVHTFRPLVALRNIFHVQRLIAQ